MKYHRLPADHHYLRSPPTRGAWIEIMTALEAAAMRSVAPHTGGVD